MKETLTVASLTQRRRILIEALREHGRFLQPLSPSHRKMGDHLLELADRLAIAGGGNLSEKVLHDLRNLRPGVGRAAGEDLRDPAANRAYHRRLRIIWDGIGWETKTTPAPAGELTSASRQDIRMLEPRDFGPVIEVVDEWWGGRQMRAHLPRFFFDHFSDTGIVIEEGDRLVAFLIGFLSSARASEAYIHFAGVAPHRRRSGLATELYSRFFALARAGGRDVVRAITAPSNTGSIAFHLRLGFELEPSRTEIGGLPIHVDQDPLGEARVVLVKHLAPH